MKKQLFLFLFLIPVISQCQNVGYQGKKFIVEAGIFNTTDFAGSTFNRWRGNSGGRRLNSILETQVKIYPELNVSYTFTRHTSITARISPFNSSNMTYVMAYYIDNMGQYDTFSYDNKGVVLGLGIMIPADNTRYGFAPVGLYWGLMVNIYQSKMIIDESTLSRPDLYTAVDLKNTLWGGHLAIGNRTIILEKFTFTWELDLGSTITIPNFSSTDLGNYELGAGWKEAANEEAAYHMVIIGNLSFGYLLF